MSLSLPSWLRQYAVPALAVAIAVPVVAVLRAPTSPALAVQPARSQTTDGGYADGYARFVVTMDTAAEAALGEVPARPDGGARASRARSGATAIPAPSPATGLLVPPSQGAYTGDNVSVDAPLTPAPSCPPASNGNQGQGNTGNGNGNGGDNANESNNGNHGDGNNGHGNANGHASDCTATEAPTGTASTPPAVPDVPAAPAAPAVAADLTDPAAAGPAVPAEAQAAVDLVVGALNNPFEGIAGIIAAVRLDARTWAITTTLTQAAVATIPGVAEVEDDLPLWPFSDDTRFAEQWALDNTGQAIGQPGTRDADIDWPLAAQVATGAGVVVAVIDTGVDLTHPELAGAIWRNVDEICGNRADDDANGFVDDCQGWDFANGDATVYDTAGDTDNRHGTHIAGTIAARAGDSQGIAGIAPDAQVMVLKVLQGSNFPSSRAARAIDYAIANGASIINASWGTTPGSAPGSALTNAIARAEQAGVLVVAAAGNSGSDLATSPTYPASYTHANVITVGASTNRDERANFSNFGEGVDLFAPGSAVLSTLPGGGHGFFDGTSMAAPHVAGAAALTTQTTPQASAADLRALLIATSDHVPGLESSVADGARLNAGAAAGRTERAFTVAFEGYGAIPAGTEHPAVLEAHVPTPRALPANRPVGLRATLAFRDASGLYGVIDHPLAVGEGDAARTVTTDETGRVVLTSAGGLSDAELAALVEGGLRLPVATTLPAGDFALLVELVDMGDAAAPAIGEPNAIWFGVTGPAAGEPAEQPTGDEGSGTEPAEPVAAPDPSSETPTPDAPADSPTTAESTDPEQEGTAAPLPVHPDPITTMPQDPTAPAAPEQPAPSEPGTAEPAPAEPAEQITVEAEVEAEVEVVVSDPLATEPSEEESEPAEEIPGLQVPSPEELMPEVPALPVVELPDTDVPSEPTPEPTVPAETDARSAAVAPAAGPATGGGLAVVSGDFPDPSAVLFGGLPATVVIYHAPSTVSVLVPPHAPGMVDVEVLGRDGTRLLLPNAYEYIDVFNPDAPASPTLPQISTPTITLPSIPTAPSLTGFGGLLPGEPSDPGTGTVVGTVTGVATGSDPDGRQQPPFRHANGLMLGGLAEDSPLRRTPADAWETQACTAAVCEGREV